MGLDDRLLNIDNNEDKTESSPSKAGALNEARRGNQENETVGTEEEPPSLREAVMAGKKEQSVKDKEEQSVASGLAKKAAAPMRKGTSRLLRGAWQSLIDTGGLSAIFVIPWANIHVFLGTVLGNNLFCKLGEEWKDALPLPTPVKDAGEDKVSKAVGTGEKLGLACVDLGCLFSCLFQLALIAMIVGFLDNPLRALIEILKSVFANWN
jgi:hypothetical protein